MQNNRQTWLKNHIYDYRDRVLSISKRIAYLCAFVGFLLLVIRYGFILDDESVDLIFDFIHLVLAALALGFGFRTFYDHHWKAYLKKSWFETSIMIVLLVHSLFEYGLDIRIAQEFFTIFHFENPELRYQHLISVLMALLVGLEIVRASTLLSEINWKPDVTFLMSFVVLILGGTGLLMLPAMTVGSDSMRFIDALFTAVSASCVTGLIVVDTATYFTLKGQLVILFLIQLGGIGIVSFATFFATFMSKGVSIKHQSMIQDYLSSDSLVSATGLLRKVIFITLLIEIVGAVLVFFTWEDDLMLNAENKPYFDSLGKKIFYSFFHSVSAFCNGGFSLFSGGLNDTDWNTHRMYGLHMVIALVITFGSLGFTTIQDIFSWASIRERVRKPWKKLNVGSQISLYMTAALTIFGAVVVMVLEYDKLHNSTIMEAFVTSIFQSVTTRTAGFNTMEFGEMRDATTIIMLFLMFVGACPGSTGGGIKTSTFFIIIISSLANIKRQERIVIASRTIPNELVRKAFSIFMIAVTYNVVAIFLLTISEDGKNILDLAFEQVSAFATVGLTRNGLTGTLSDFGKTIIIISMYLGRVGTLTLALALSNAVISNSYRYPETQIMVG